MRVIELIEELQAMLEQHGNCEVYIGGGRCDEEYDAPVESVKYEPETAEYFEAVVLR